MDKEKEEKAVYMLIEKYRNSKKPVDYSTLIEDYNLICKELEEDSMHENNSNLKNR